MIDTIVCIGCGTPKSRKTSKDGWSTMQWSAPGLGRRYYRNCGCMSPALLHELSAELFRDGCNLPRRVAAIVHARARGEEGTCTS